MPSARRAAKPKKGGCRLHRDIQKGISPAMVDGAMTKNSADPRTAVTLLIVIAPKLFAFKCEGCKLSALRCRKLAISIGQFASNLLQLNGLVLFHVHFSARLH